MGAGNVPKRGDGDVSLRYRALRLAYWLLLYAGDVANRLWLWFENRADGVFGAMLDMDGGLNSDSWSAREWHRRL